ncbi:ubiquitin carboxyl-terminal hydrolase 2-like [Eucyclogobius newberryi]|uniref:ubiquitin carboxyl-terminal hydrolase 2-like n=1 Tax=Eucyclogobius newberryi TaxID=166745 RepID=UPI003B59D078
MKPKALSIKECAWTSEECHFLDDGSSQSNGLCLPNIFRPKRIKPLSKTQNGPTFQVYYTARELFTEVLDRRAVRGLTRRATSAKSGANRSSYNSSKDHNVDLSTEGEYMDALTWFSVVLKSGIFVDGKCDSNLTLDGWQGVLKRNSFLTDLTSLTRLEDVTKLEILTAFCSHLSRRYQSLYTPGLNLTIKKYQLSYQHDLSSLHLALLCDDSTGFICNMFLYIPGQMQKQSRKPVIQQVISHLLRPFCSNSHVVTINSSAWTDGRLTGVLANFGLNIHFIPSAKTSQDLTTHRKRRANQESELAAHLQGWTGPALFCPSYPKGSEADVFLPGLWAALHVVCINTFVLHTLQNQGSARSVELSDFTKSLGSQLVVDPIVSVPALPRLHSSYQDGPFTEPANQRSAETNSCGPVLENEKMLKNHPGVCGLDNSGNSCYLNAVLQCLCSTVPLVEYLLQHDTRKELRRSKCRVAEGFVRLLEQMWLGRSSRCAPVEARAVLCSVLPQFNNHQQQDAQELLMYSINALHDDLKKVSRRQLGLEQKRSALRSDSSVVSRLFEGRLSGVTLCLHCDHQAHSSQPFTILSLPIPSGLISCSIQDCLSLFFEQSVLNGGEEVLCSECGLRRETAVVTYLDKPPDILVLHLKRFGCKGKSQVKLKTNVDFSTDRLDLSPFLSSSVCSSTSCSYGLYAVVNHIGHLHMGHYTALCFNTVTQAWHCFDDSVVRPVEDVLVQSPHAYILLYSRKPFLRPQIQGL